MIPLLLRDDRKRRRGKNTRVEGEQKGGERREMGDEGMLALRRGTCCRRRRGYLGGRSTVGGIGKSGLDRGAAGGGTRQVSKEEGFLD